MNGTNGSECPLPAGSFWETVKQAPDDGLLSLTVDYLKDPSLQKLNIGVGAYRTEEGKPRVLDVVRRAEEILLADKSQDKEYLPISGNAEFCELSRKLAFGDCKRALDGSIVTMQSVSGSGSIRVLAEFIATQCPRKEIYLSDPAWANYENIFPKAGLKLQYYRHYNSKTKGLDIEGLLEDLSQAKPGAAVVLQTCAHNPTGVDPTKEQWQRILEVVKSRRLLPFLDSAYQGFATGDLDDDSYALRLFESAGLDLLFAHSFSKNMGLYGERAGALSVACQNPMDAKRVDSQLRALIRANYATPPRHGAAVVCIILKTPELYEQWQVELKEMADRIRQMREKLSAAISERKTPGDWSGILTQIGMFAYSGLTPSQVEHLTKKWHVYLPASGRMSMAGLSSESCKYLADAIDDAVRNVV